MRVEDAGTITLGSAVVTVRGVRRAVFVEFEYSLADGALAVELIMPLHALREFQGARNAELRFATPDAERAYTDLLSVPSNLTS
ncbi:MAG: phenol hydroxylase subunit [Candidatus Velthaea sp.]|jgi:hypothetical protein